MKKYAGGSIFILGNKTLTIANIPLPILMHSYIVFRALYKRTLLFVVYYFIGVNPPAKGYVAIQQRNY